MAKQQLKLSEIRFWALVLVLLARTQSGKMSESTLISEAERTKFLTSWERERVPSRNDSRFANRIHRIIYHRESRKNFLRRGYLEWDSHEHTLQITERGHRFLEQIWTQLVGNPSDAQASGNINVAQRLIIEEWLGRYVAKDVS